MVSKIDAWPKQVAIVANRYFQSVLSISVQRNCLKSTLFWPLHLSILPIFSIVGAASIDIKVISMLNICTTKPTGANVMITYTELKRYVLHQPAGEVRNILKLSTRTVTTIQHMDPNEGKCYSYLTSWYVSKKERDMNEKSEDIKHKKMWIYNSTL